MCWVYLLFSGYIRGNWWESASRYLLSDKFMDSADYFFLSNLLKTTTKKEKPTLWHLFLCSCSLDNLFILVLPDGQGSLCQCYLQWVPVDSILSSPSTRVCALGLHVGSRICTRSKMDSLWNVAPAVDLLHPVYLFSSGWPASESNPAKEVPRNRTGIYIEHYVTHGLVLKLLHTQECIQEVLAALGLWWAPERGGLQLSL